MPGFINTGTYPNKNLLQNKKQPYFYQLKLVGFLLNLGLKKLGKDYKDCIFATGKSYTTSSCRILQGGNAAKVDGRSGVMWVACPFFMPFFEL